MLIIIWTEKRPNSMVLFGAGSIDGLRMLSGMTTYLMTLSKGKCLARLLLVGKPKRMKLLHDVLKGGYYFKGKR